MSSSLDLSRPARQSTTASLDLSSTPTPAQAASRAAPVNPPAVIHADDRVRAGERTVLTVRSPTVTLTRTQSAIGSLTFEAAVSAQVGDLRIGCAYELRSGLSSTVGLSGGNRFGPPQSRRPVLVAGHDRYDRIAVDLRQCHELDRLLVYAYSESRQPLVWGGTLIVTTLAGAKIELPLEQLPTGEIAVLMSVYNVRGEFVLRAEMQPIVGSIRDACRAYGYDRITWLDDRTPVD